MEALKPLVAPAKPSAFVRHLVEQYLKAHGNMKTVKIYDELHRKIELRAGLRGVSIEAITEAALITWLENDDKLLDEQVWKGKL